MTLMITELVQPILRGCNKAPYFTHSRPCVAPLYDVLTRSPRAAAASAAASAGEPSYLGAYSTRSTTGGHAGLQKRVIIVWWARGGCCWGSPLISGRVAPQDFAHRRQHKRNFKA
jgi:hypothetical protein